MMFFTQSVLAGALRLSDTLDLWELPYEGKTVYVLLAARSIVSALMDSDGTGSLSSSGGIRSRAAQCPTPGGLADKLPAACLICERAGCLAGEGR